MPRFLTSILLFSLLALFTLPAYALKQGAELPEIKGTTIDGQDFDLSALKGQPILLKVGTTWCPTCKDQTKAISNLDGFLAENNVQVVDVFLQENEKTIRKYFDKGNFTLPDTVLIDNGPIYRALNIYLIPRVILIDKDFKVFRDSDGISQSQLKKRIETMLAPKE